MKSANSRDGMLPSAKYPLYVDKGTRPSAIYSSSSSFYAFSSLFY